MLSSNNKLINSELAVVKVVGRVIKGLFPWGQGCVSRVLTRVQIHLL